EVMFYLAVPLLFKKIRSLDSAVRFCMVSAVFAVIANAVFGWLLRSHPSLSNYGWDNYRLYCGRWTGEHELIG
ncbi:MAG: hypothetical protein P4L61_00655, partial [Candidatus Pacebacteria bacterium]|nr:hypothetical protein [Candidatus Paceibacterota bacterium]